MEGQKREVYSGTNPFNEAESFIDAASGITQFIHQTVKGEAPLFRAAFVHTFQLK